MTDNLKRPDISIREVLSPERILFLENADKREALTSLIRCIASSGGVSDPEELSRGIFHRESLMSTGIGLGIGVPHVRIGAVKKPVMAVGVCKTPITDYESIDDKPVELVFMIVAGENQHKEHLTLLSYISNRCKEEEFRKALLAAQSPEEAFELLAADA